MTEPTRPARRSRSRHAVDRPRPRHAYDDAPDHAPSLSDPLPDPIGDVVPGDPAVPITVWHLPRPAAGTLVSAAVLRRLIVNYTRPGAHTIDLTAGGQLTAGDRPCAALVITGWPSGHLTATEHLTACARALHPGGFLAVVITATETPDQLGVLVAAARAVGLNYLQHIVIAHHLTPFPPAAPTTRQGRHRLPTPASERVDPPARGGPHLRVHTDLLILMTPAGARA
jgi:hypothetical protein